MARKPKAQLNPGGNPSRSVNALENLQMLAAVASQEIDVHDTGNHIAASTAGRGRGKRDDANASYFPALSVKGSQTESPGPTRGSQRLLHLDVMEVDEPELINSHTLLTAASVPASEEIIGQPSEEKIEARHAREAIMTQSQAAKGGERFSGPALQASSIDGFSDSTGELKSRLDKMKSRPKMSALLDKVRSRLDNDDDYREFLKYLLYVIKVKARFQTDEYHVYEEFVKIVNMCRKGKKTFNKLQQEVASLFENHSDLLEEFRNFLPRHRQDTRVFDINKLQQEVASLLLDHSDLLVEFRLYFPPDTHGSTLQTSHAAVVKPGQRPRHQVGTRRDLSERRVLAGVNVERSRHPEPEPRADIRDRKKRNCTKEEARSGAQGECPQGSDRNPRRARSI